MCTLIYNQPSGNIVLLFIWQWLQSHCAHEKLKLPYVLRNLLSFKLGQSHKIGWSKKCPYNNLYLLYAFIFILYSVLFCISIKNLIESLVSHSSLARCITLVILVIHYVHNSRDSSIIDICRQTSMALSMSPFADIQLFAAFCGKKV